MSPIVTMYIWYNKCRVRTEFMWDCIELLQVNETQMEI